MLPPVPQTGSLKTLALHVKKIQQFIESITGDCKTILVSKTGGITISAMGGNGGGGGGSPSAYKGPWAVTQKDDTKLTLLGYNDTEGRHWVNTLTAGLIETTIAEQDITVTAPGQLYMDVTESVAVYSVAFVTGTKPAQAAGHWYFELGMVGFAGGKITYWQPTYPGGQIHIMGKIV